MENKTGKVSREIIDPLECAAKYLALANLIILCLATAALSVLIIVTVVRSL